MSQIVFVFHPSDDTGFKAAVDFHYFDECTRLFFKPWPWGYAYRRWGMYVFGFAWFGVMFWSAKEKTGRSFTPEPTEER